MIELMKITGLDYATLSEIMGFFMCLISFSVVFGLIIYNGIFGGIDVLITLIRAIMKRIKCGVSHYGKESRP